MPNKYVNWIEIRPPREDSLDNLNKLVSAFDRLGATHPNAKVAPYTVAKTAGVAYSRASALLQTRPGFVAVIYKGDKIGYYWDKSTFGTTYPANYIEHTRRQVLSEYDITPEESLGEKAQAARQIEQAIETVTGKVAGKTVPILFDRGPAEGMVNFEYRIIFSALPPSATAGDVAEAIKEKARILLDTPTDRDALMQVTLINLALLHAEKEKNSD